MDDNLNNTKVIKPGFASTIWKSSPKLCQYCKCTFYFDENDITFIDKYLLTRLIFKRPFEFQRHDESIIRGIPNTDTNQQYLGVHCPECQDYKCFLFSGKRLLPDVVLTRIKSRDHHVIFEFNKGHSQILTPDDFECIEIESHDYVMQPAYQCRSHISKKNIVIFPEQLHQSIKNHIYHKDPIPKSFEYYYSGNVDPKNIEDRSCTIL